MPLLPNSLDLPSRKKDPHRLMSIADYGFNPIQDGFFRGCSRMGLGFLAPLPKIRHTYPTTIKVGTVIPYLRKIQKMYESCDTSLEF